MKIAIGPSSFAAEDDTPHQMLQQRGFEIVANPFGRRLTEEEIGAHLEGVDGLIAGLEPLSRQVLGRSKQLRAIARVGIGMDNVDLDAAAEFGIKISNTPDAPAEAVAEMTLAAMLSLGRGIDAANRALHAGEWKKSVGTGLRDTIVLIVGYGRIGRRVGELARAFGARLLVVEPQLDTDGPDFERVSLAAGLERADIVTLHASGADTLLGPVELANIKPGALLLNCARGGLVDEPSLIEALKAKRVRGAWVDTFVDEPYNGPLREYPQVLLTPHVGTYTRQCRREMETRAVENLCRDLGQS
jgi:D-3-phosphoglycerate dehydrogenase